MVIITIVATSITVINFTTIASGVITGDNAQIYIITIVVVIISVVVVVLSRGW